MAKRTPSENKRERNYTPVTAVPTLPAASQYHVREYGPFTLAEGKPVLSIRTASMTPISDVITLSWGKNGVQKITYYDGQKTTEIALEEDALSKQLNLLKCPNVFLRLQTDRQQDLGEEAIINPVKEIIKDIQNSALKRITVVFSTNDSLDKAFRLLTPQPEEVVKATSIPSVASTSTNPVALAATTATAASAQKFQLSMDEQAMRWNIGTSYCLITLPEQLPPVDNDTIVISGEVDSTTQKISLKYEETIFPMEMRSEEITAEAIEAVVGAFIQTYRIQYSQFHLRLGVSIAASKVVAAVQQWVQKGTLDSSLKLTIAFETQQIIGEIFELPII